MGIVAWIVLGYAIAVVVCCFVVAIVEVRKESKRVRQAFTTKFALSLKESPHV